MPERRLSRLLKAKLLRRSSTPAVPKAGNGADPRAHPNSTSPSSCAPHLFDSASDKTPYSLVSSAAEHSADELGPGPAPDQHEDRAHNPRSRSRNEPLLSASSPHPGPQQPHRRPRLDQRACTPPPTEPSSSPRHTPLTGDLPSPIESPLPTPQHSDDTSFQAAQIKARGTGFGEQPATPTLDTVVESTANDRRPSSTFFPPPSTKRPSIAIRRQSLLPLSHQHLISGLLEQNLFPPQSDASVVDRASAAPVEMVHRRVWVKRPGGSATLVPCLEDAVVDELRDQVIMKYANSLGRTFDSPDIVIRILAREASSRQTPPERLLSPEETISSVLDTYYPGGQTIEEALIIDAPTRRTPKLSPRHAVYHHHSEPGEHGEYFPLMPVNPNAPTPPAHSSSSGQTNAPSISILTTGVPPPLPSPGNRGNRHHRRPPLNRHTTSSPTTLPNGATVTGKRIAYTVKTHIANNYRTWHFSALPSSSPGPKPKRAHTSCASARVSSNKVTHPACTSRISAIITQIERCRIARRSFRRID